MRVRLATTPARRGAAAFVAIPAAHRRPRVVLTARQRRARPSARRAQAVCQSSSCRWRQPVLLPPASVWGLLNGRGTGAHQAECEKNLCTLLGPPEILTAQQRREEWSRADSDAAGHALIKILALSVLSGPPYSGLNRDLTSRPKRD